MFKFKHQVWRGQGLGTARCCSGEMGHTGPPRKLRGTFKALQNIRAPSGCALLPFASSDTPHSSSLQISAHVALPARNMFYFWPSFPPGTQGQLILGTSSDTCSLLQTLFPDFPNQSYPLFAPGVVWALNAPGRHGWECLQQSKRPGSKRPR